MNQVIRLTVIDPLRRYTTWYGYDHNGRVDSVWTKLENPGSGLWDADSNIWAYPAGVPNRADTAEISYRYTKTAQVDSMFYPRISTFTSYHYSPRKWLDTLVAMKAGSNIFKEYLTFDPTGQIRKQVSQQGTASVRQQNYTYDNLGQLVRWVRDTATGSQYGENYLYDSVGNRLNVYREDYTGSVSSWLNYDIGRRTDTSAGPN